MQSFRWKRVAQGEQGAAEGPEEDGGGGVCTSMYLSLDKRRKGLFHESAISNLPQQFGTDVQENKINTEIHTSTE